MPNAPVRDIVTYYEEAGSGPPLIMIMGFLIAGLSLLFGLFQIALWGTFECHLIGKACPSTVCLLDRVIDLWRASAESRRAK